MLDGGYGDGGRKMRSRRRARRSRSTSSSSPTTGGASSRASSTAPVDLADDSDVLAVDDDRTPRRTGSKPGRAADSDLRLRDLEGVEDLVQHVDGVVRVDGAIGLYRLSHDTAGQHGGQVQRLLGQERVLRSRGEEHVPELEQPDVGQAVGAVARHGPQQAGEDARAQDRLLGPQRVRRLHETVDRGAGAFEVARRETSGKVTASEQPRARRARRRPGDVRAADGSGHRPAGPGRGTVRPMRVESDPSRDLLDDVDLALEVGTERGRGRGDLVARSGDLDAQGPQCVEDLGVGRGRVPSTRFTLLVRTWMRGRSIGRGYSSTALGATCRGRDLGEQLHRPLGVLGARRSGRCRARSGRWTRNAA